MHFDIDKHTVFLARHGSHSYGTSTPESDLDIRGFAVAPKSHVLGFAYNFEQNQIQDETQDKVVYDIRKFCRLAADCNPNALEVLFVDDSDVLFEHPAGKLIRDNRDLFLSKKARATFSGYSISQLKRIKTHRGYILNPPTHKPSREEFGLTLQQKITPDMMGAFDKVTVDGGDIHPNVMELVQKEKQYKSALDRWNQHESWKTNRNPKRAAIEAEFGLDLKHALHLVRLLKMCREILEGKGLIVRRPDALELLEIRNGKWSYDQIVDWAEAEDFAMQDLYAASTLRHAPDIDRINELCIEAQEIFWRSL